MDEHPIGNDQASTDPSLVDNGFQREIDLHLTEADKALGIKNWASAQRHYKYALDLLRPEQREERAHVLTGLAEVAVANKDLEQALSAMTQAMLDNPTSEGAIRRALDLTVGMDRYGMSMELRRRLLEFPIDEQERVAHYRALVYDATSIGIDALLWLKDASLGPGFDVLDRLRGTYEAAGDVESAADVMVMQAEAITDPLLRAEAMVRAADFCAKRAQNTARAVALYEAAIADNPAVQGAFDAIERVLIEKEDWQQLERAYVRQVQRLEQAGATKELASLFGRLALVRHDHLGDAEGATQALTRRVQLEPANVEARALLGALLEHSEKLDLACRVLEAGCWHAPTRTQTYHDLFRIYSRAKKQDHAFHASGALVYLGDADLEQQLSYQQYRPEAGLHPTGTLQESDWSSLYPVDQDEQLRELLTLIGPVAIRHRLAELEATGKLTKVADKYKQDPHTTTVTAVRSVAWAARVLGLEVPDVYAVSDFPAGITAIPGHKPAVCIGKALLSGRSMAELAFLIGHHLTYYRPEHRLLLYYQSLTDLTQVITRAVVVSRKGPDVSPSAFGAGLGTALRQGLTLQQWDALVRVVNEVNAKGDKINPRAYARSLEITATRVGLLLCGDLPTAGVLLSSDVREVAGLRAADRMKDLLPFAMSYPYMMLRQRLGISHDGDTDPC